MGSWRSSNGTYRLAPTRSQVIRRAGLPQGCGGCCQFESAPPLRDCRRWRGRRRERKERPGGLHLDSATASCALVGNAPRWAVSCRVKMPVSPCDPLANQACQIGRPVVQHVAFQSRRRYWAPDRHRLRSQVHPHLRSPHPFWRLPSGGNCCTRLPPRKQHTAAGRPKENYRR